MHAKEFNAFSYGCPSPPDFRNVLAVVNYSSIAHGTFSQTVEVCKEFTDLLIDSR